jgi:hypothetical protein
MPRLSFTLRDVFWLTLVVALGVGWWMSLRHAANKANEAQNWRNVAYFLNLVMEKDGWLFSVSETSIQCDKRALTPAKSAILHSHGLRRDDIPFGVDDPYSP